MVFPAGKLGSYLSEISTRLGLFRLTCIGFHLGTMGFMFLPRRRWQLLSLRVAMLWNSVSYWLVSSSWCFDGGNIAWHALTFLVLFTLVGATDLLALPPAEKVQVRRLSQASD